MSAVKTLKCQSCGSSAVTVINESLAECDHCGTQLVLKNTAPNDGPASNKKRNIYIVIFSVVLLIFIAVWLSVDYQPEQLNTQPQLPYQLNVQSGHQQPVEDAESVVEINKKTNDDVVKEVQKPRISITHQVKGETFGGGVYWILAIRNDSAIKVNRANVVASLFDETGKRVDEQAGWSKHEILAPTEESVVLLYIADPPKVPYTVELMAQGKPLNAFSSAEELLDVGDFIVKNTGEKRYEIIGDVVNTKEYQMDFVKVVAVAMNENNQPIGVADAFVSSTNIAARQQSGFKITAGTFLTQTPGSWSLWAKGRKHKP